MNEAKKHLDAIVEPLIELVSELDADVTRLERELSEARELRRNVKTVLRTLRPEPKSKPKAKSHTQARAEKKQRVRTHLLAKGVHDDITAPGLKDNGLGDPPISLGMLYGILQELRDDGYLRLDRVTNGGQQVYRRAIP